MAVRGNKVDDFCAVFESSLKDIAERTDPSTRCLILSGGVDTCAILQAASQIGMTFAAAVTVVTGDDSPDGAFATAAAKQHGLPHFIVKLNAKELVEAQLKPCIQELETFDGMTLRNSLVVAAAFQKVAELGFNDAIVGDGADELFGGYSFTWKTEDSKEWKEKRDSMCAQWTFATESLANMHGLKSHSPYMEPQMVEWSIENTQRSDCIGKRPIQLVYGGEYQDHITGKIILRQAYETVASWRRKDPIEVGSGITVIGHDDYWKHIISDEEFETETRNLLGRGFVISSKENLVNFRVFEECFGRQDGNETIMDLLNKKRLELGRGCKGCCFEIGDSTFCHVCGAYPAQRDS
jgi:asparagine synthase (glutamine-hydrolysing)